MKTGDAEEKMFRDYQVKLRNSEHMKIDNVKHAQTYDNTVQLVCADGTTVNIEKSEIVYLIAGPPRQTVSERI